jgi:hypothetical protein
VIFGKTVFQSVLERMNEDDARDEEPATLHVRGLNTGFVADRLGLENASQEATPDSYSSLRNLYFDFPTPEPEPEKPAPPPVMPAHLAHIAPEEIAAELAITQKDTLISLNRKRRIFAAANHPDQVDEQWRDKANARMKIANLLIDEAIRKLHP